MQEYKLQTGENNPILRRKSEEVREITDEIKEFARDLKTLMVTLDGVGLAAPQIGRNVRIIAVTRFKLKRLSGDMEIKDRLVMINPVIVDHGSKMKSDEEACLSLPGLIGTVKRYTEIEVKFLDLEGKEQKIYLSGFNARIVQHEIDHLDGILFIDKASNIKKESKLPQQEDPRLIEKKLGIF